jgi:Zn-dependent peptidase ImmA (M78 family)/transcriptional regulator with XRE-family HTH domain
MFNGRRLSLARKRRRLTARALAERADVAADTISRLEIGTNQPDESTVGRLATALSFPQDFFFGQDLEAIDTDAVSFRSFSKMSAKERDAAISAGTLGLQLGTWIEQRFTLPKANLLDLSYETNPEAAAYMLRRYWGLGERPIGNMLGLLETHGVRVFSLSENTASVNAFSFWRDDKPFVFLNNFKTAESSVFDTAHELCHLVMHKHGDPKGSRTVEREANLFASAFLMPANDVKARVPHGADISILLKAKFRWRVSAMAMAYRVHQLGRISEWQYKSVCVELGRRGYRSGEPDGIERETSIVWRKLLAQLWTERITKNEIAKQLNLPLDELEGLIWNLAAVSNVPARLRDAEIRLIG